MKAIHKKRLLTLYNHMRQPQKKLYHKEFMFRYFGNACGTAGCMAGELVGLFPSNWQWFCEVPLLRKSSSLMTLFDLMHFFNLTKMEVSHLFYPHRQSVDIDPQCKYLSDRATKEEVVNNLKRFLIIKQIL